jgi:hypothetical protein
MIGIEKGAAMRMFHDQHPLFLTHRLEAENVDYQKRNAHRIHSESCRFHNETHAGKKARAICGFLRILSASSALSPLPLIVRDESPEPH